MIFWTGLVWKYVGLVEVVWIQCKRQKETGLVRLEGGEIKGGKGREFPRKSSRSSKPEKEVAPASSVHCDLSPPVF